MKGHRTDAGKADGVFPALSHARLGVCGHPSLGVLSVSSVLALHPQSQSQGKPQEECTAGIREGEPLGANLTQMYRLSPDFKSAKIM